MNSHSSPDARIAFQVPIVMVFVIVTLIAMIASVLVAGLVGGFFGPFGPLLVTAAWLSPFITLPIVLLAIVLSAVLVRLLLTRSIELASESLTAVQVLVLILGVGIGFAASISDELGLLIVTGILFVPFVFSFFVRRRLEEFDS